MKLIIDGKQLEAEGHKTILEAAQENNIFIPSLCDHPQLTPFGGCRLCIVEIKGRKGFAPSCSTYPEESMEVKTDSVKLRRLRKQIMGLILSEHPDACLICSEKENCDEYKSTIRKVGEVTGCVLCPNNGRCELQDVVEAVRIEKIDFPSLYRDYEVRKDDPFFDRNYNLCILCGRCVRVCHEIRGASTVTFVFRGSKAVVGTVLDRPLREAGCQFCGACVDVCPTGALTERSIKYEPLPENQAHTICPLCSIGCELDVMLNRGRIVSTRPSQEGVVNQGQACVKGRFVIKDTVYSSQRILKPLIRRNKELEEVSWEEALDFVAKRIKAYKGKEIGLVPSPQISCEDNYLLEKFAQEVIKSKTISISTHISPFESFYNLVQKRQIKPQFNFKKEDISEADVIFLTETDLAVSHPILWLEVLKAVREGAKLIMVSPIEPLGSRYASIWLQVKPGSESELFNFLSKRLIEKAETDERKLEGFEAFRKSLDKLTATQLAEATGIDKDDLNHAAELLRRGRVCFVFGMGLIRDSWEDQNLAVLWNLALQTQGQLVPLGLENNSRGLFEIKQGALQKAKPFSQIMQEVREGQIKALYLIGSVPLDKKTKVEFLVIQDSYMDEMTEKADAVFPSTTFAETEGTFINTEGRIQRFQKIIEPLGEAKPDWWIVSQLATRLGKKVFNYKKSSDILTEMKKAIPAFSMISTASQEKGKSFFVHETGQEKEKFIVLKPRDRAGVTSKAYPFLLLSEYNLDHYRNLTLSEEIKGLEIIRNPNWIKMSPEDAKTLDFKDGDDADIVSPKGKIKGIIRITDSVPEGVVGSSLLPLLPVKIKRGK
ncbi:MAG: molybdopterin-dependent oxidoreductase [Candidatus Aminicenantes bacterium]|nr:molybdopterin-dependent oxidoreductase [Candidatus Aminicenantes bacterium]